MGKISLSIRLKKISYHMFSRVFVIFSGSYFHIKIVFTFSNE